MLNAYYSKVLSFSRSDEACTPGIIYLREDNLVYIEPVGEETFDSVVLDGKDIVAIVGLAKEFLSYDQKLEIMDLVKDSAAISE